MTAMTATSLGTVMNAVLGVAYWIAQLLGAVLAALLLRWIFPAANRDATNLGAPSVHTIDIGAALVVEALITFFVVWVVFALTTDERNAYTAVAGLAIGFVFVFGMAFVRPGVEGWWEFAKSSASFADLDVG